MITQAERALDVLRFQTPADAKVTVRDVWSNGNIIRKYVGQDRPGFHTKRTAAERGFRKMTVILIDKEAAE